MKKKLNKKEFCDEILKLAPSEYDASKCDFQQHLENLFNRYIKLLDRLDESEYRKRWGSWDEKKEAIIKFCDAIKESINLYYEGRHSCAFTHLWNHINEISFNSTLFYGKDLYRMRMFDEGEKHNRNGMFHIPFNKRTIVKTQRYSAPGYPCLYLGKSAYICWEEMLRPNLDKCYVSRFHTDEPMFVYDLTLPSISKWNNNIDAFRDDLLSFPLVIACMVKVAKPKDPFKPEYIIPQLLMELVIEERQNVRIINVSKKIIIGIAYTSVHKSNDFKFTPDKSVNLAIPAFPPAIGDYSMKLCEMFKVTDPTCDELERAKRPYEIIERDRDMTDLEYSYRISTFGQLEARLNEEKKFPLKKVRNVTKTDIYSKEVLFE